MNPNAEGSERNLRTVEMRNGSFKKNFTFKRDLGKGSGGAVHLCVENENEEPCAIKIIPIEEDQPFPPQLMEVEVLESLQRATYANELLERCILNYQDAWCEEYDHYETIPFKTKKKIQTRSLHRFAFIRTEYIEGKTLHQFLKSKTTENHQSIVNKGKKYLALWAKSLMCLHAFECIHRDLNFGNIMLTSIDGIEAVKIIDFGTSVFLQDACSYRKGNPCIRSPEMNDFDGRGGEYLRYGTTTDMWALGMALYCILIPTQEQTGSGRDYAQIMKNLQQKLIENNYNLNLDFEVSETDRRLLNALFQPDPSKRITSERLYEIVKVWEGNTERIEVPIDMSSLENL